MKGFKARHSSVDSSSILMKSNLIGLQLASSKGHLLNPKKSKIKQLKNLQGSRSLLENSLMKKRNGIKTS